MAAISKDTQALVQRMMKDAGLTPFQQRQLNGSLQRGTSLPTKVKPTTSKPDATPAPKPKPKTVFRGPPTSTRRRQGDILEQTRGYARERYHSHDLGPAREDAKDRFYDIMAFGRETADRKESIKQRGRESSRASTAASAPAALARKSQPREVDLFDIVVQEVEERRAHREKLRSIGQLDAVTDRQLQTEISQRIRQLEMMDRERAKTVRR
ncbi:uncharacterized protein MONBRDRAFT_36699 [Monosiga brevicollis MX1]|uniref:Uncharacterized protein n=1 Tax=Monosiga brevicollis TaxID=81824 RepID=A9UWY3_MONBE|nr:uncharacterized protein MONBRDRAFT_36699 [Monosiga brevicollis MX1]EDQ90297.1 predicted protein [Monosiga brevicollis MX1]|eukprot:XP_001745064.1 hypothetical protein [Monosiga brevicollis MX1]